MQDSQSDRLPPLSGWKSGPVCFTIPARTGTKIWDFEVGRLPAPDGQSALQSYLPPSRCGVREDEIAAPGRFRIDSLGLGSGPRVPSSHGTFSSRLNA
ncbi:hypothetical protein PtA15_13A271 [Puccinia triticina]|uniref:Uncharacterized protein n=1 Tax=Puccinia triticina TaxID=208348 RepID=A0ABY7D0B6_9BASI|nr:uncharacterized protein PtA15_13A271 [Puccinia triticina]WAQ90871.1 hypothetical protein PtA15_13A271 [Puccinia triticina]WAR61063.1 hypothetical protein PtB15_13B315 [Puccinia triticina]